MGPKSISAYAAKHFELSNHYFITIFDVLIPTFVAQSTKNQTDFHSKIPKSTFRFQCKNVCCLLYNANIVEDVNDLQQKYAKVKSLRRSG